jgi:putative membrane protein insertion efficiency factor
MGRSQGKRALLISLLVATGLMAHDVAVTPVRAFGARSAVAAIDQYRVLVSPHLYGVVRCRFTPTCSLYGRESIRKYGLARGGWRTLRRIARCAPWTPMGTVDLP